MGIKTKFALAAAFAGVAAMTAAAFGEGGSTATAARTAEPTAQSSTDRPTPPDERRPGAAERRQQRRDRCPGPAGGRPMRLVHRESIFQVREGFATLTVDQGKITKIDGRTITIERLDGKSVTATANDETKVCKDGEPSTVDALKVGDLARFMRVRSPKINGLRRIVAVTPRADSSTASPADFSGDELAELSGEIY
jgi:hypothetical protein